MGAKRKTEQQVIAQLDEVHAGRIRLVPPYLGTMYKNNFVCTAGHSWQAIPNSVLQGRGCRQCWIDSSRRPPVNGVLAAIKLAHSGRIKLVSEYTGAKDLHTFECHAGHQWQTRPVNIIAGAGCLLCFHTSRFRPPVARKPVEPRVSHHQVVARLLALHGNRVTLQSPYTRMKDNHNFTCSVGHSYEAILHNILNGSGCSKCNDIRRSSNISCDWIKAFARRTRLKFKYAHRLAQGGSGEVRLRGASGKSYQVDGYNEHYRTILEFHGDSWHGNPARYHPDSFPNPFLNKTARQLYEATIARMIDLKAAGYTVIYVWEKDWRVGHLVSDILAERKVAQAWRSRIQH